MDGIKDYNTIITKLENLRNTPPIDVPDAILKESIHTFHEQFPRSNQMFQELKKYIPSGIEHMNSIQFPFPIIMDRAEGAYLHDLDDHKFIDYLMTSGPCILGHNYPAIRDYVVDVIQNKGPATGVMSEYELLAAREICNHMKTVDKVRFYQSGTEANMAMARIARLYTGKQKIIKIGGSYHGWADQFVYDLHIPGTGNLFAHGIPPEYYAHTIAVPPNDIEALENAIINNQDKGGVAAVVLEAIGGDSGTHPPHPDYNQQVREICTKHDVLLVYDEVVAGFRLSMNGAQGFFGVDADLSVLGKIVGHEYPSAGAVGGREDIMQMVVGKGKDNKNDLGEKVFTAGTMAGTNITMAAAYKAIKSIEKTNTIEIAGNVANTLVKKLNQLFEDYHLPFFTYNYKSVIQLRTSGFYTVPLTSQNALPEILHRRENSAKYSLLLALENINTLQSIRMYTSLAHDSSNLIDQTLVGFEAFCQKLQK